MGRVSRSTRQQTERQIGRAFEIDRLRVLFRAGIIGQGYFRHQMARLGADPEPIAREVEQAQQDYLRELLRKLRAWEEPEKVDWKSEGF
jgi:hypothetical protein